MEYLDKIIITVIAEDSVLYESPYWGQHGISFYLEAFKDKIKSNILVDVAQNSQALLYNMKLLSIDPCSIDAIVLTHCHYDHTQGVVEILRAIGKKDLPIIAHPDIFRLNFITSPYLRHVGIMSGDSKKMIEENGGTLYLTDESFTIMPGLITTGEVFRQTNFEEVGIPLKTISNENKIVEDIMKDDISVVASLKDQGMIVITGCSHAGIVNILKHSSKLLGLKKFRAILGGFHLIEASRDRIDKTVEALSLLDIDFISAGHCTGFEAQVALYEKFKNKFLPLHTGLKFIYEN